jgi:predicted GH43/DUF377 family glycosyl hydrolase
VLYWEVGSLSLATILKRQELHTSGKFDVWICFSHLLKNFGIIIQSSLVMSNSAGPVSLLQLKFKIQDRGSKYG